MTFDYDVSRLPVLFSEGIEEEPVRRRAQATEPRGAATLRSLRRLLGRGIQPRGMGRPEHRARPVH